MHSDSKTGTLSDLAFRLLIGIWNFAADDEGVHVYEPDEIKAEVFPYKRQTAEKCVVRPIEEELLPKHLLVLFRFQEKIYLWSRHFKRHQKQDNPRKPIIPGFSREKMEDLFQDALANNAYSNTSPVLFPGGLAKARESSRGLGESSPETGEASAGMYGRKGKDGKEGKGGRVWEGTKPGFTQTEANVKGKTKIADELPVEVGKAVKETLERIKNGAKKNGV